LHSILLFKQTNIIIYNCISVSKKQTSHKLNPRDLGRLARCISSKDLSLAASTVLQQCNIEQIRIENNDAVDRNFALLWKWSEYSHNGIAVKDIQNALKEVDACYAEKDFEQVNKCNLSQNR